MTFFHFVNCVFLAYAPYFVAYKYSGLNEYSSVWRCAQAGFGYLITQLVKLYILATYLPATDSEGFTILPVCNLHSLILVFMREFCKFLVLLVSILILILFLSSALFVLAEMRGWLLVATRFIYSAAIAAGTFIAYATAGNMEADLIESGLNEFILPDTQLICSQHSSQELSSSHDFMPLSPTKRFGARLADSSIPPESPDMKFARRRLGTLLTSIKHGEAPAVTTTADKKS
uniref:BOS complex subunit TMEM147 n=1 Tax=Heterorhabditis bacteriophora TaxID=37862 RepID=A0A1I7WC27_HETBA